MSLALWTATASIRPSAGVASNQDHVEKTDM